MKGQTSIQAGEAALQLGPSNVISLPSRGRTVLGGHPLSLRSERTELDHSREQAAASEWPASTYSLLLHLRRNAETWDTLERLGVRDGTELPLRFCFETGGREADENLAAFLRIEAGYEVSIDRDGVSGSTRPMALSLAAIDTWVARMLDVGYEYGGCMFAGWTATVSRVV